jgi:hypothetical protein
MRPPGVVVPHELPQCPAQAPPTEADHRTLCRSALEDEDLLAQGQRLAVRVVTEQTSEHHGQRRQEDEKQVPERAGRMTGLQDEINIGSEISPPAAGRV